MLITALLVVIGWTLLDRVHAEARERQVEIKTIHLDNIDKRLAEIPAETISRQEHEALKRLIEQDHTDALAET